MKKVLGLDLGVGSIGWALIEADEGNNPINIIGMGSRIVPLSNDDANEFSTGNAISKNMARTQRRTARKCYDRYQLRRNALTEKLRGLGMLPDECLIKLPVLTLWQLRANAATPGIQLSLPEIGRVLYHLNQKRGYKHAKSDDSADAEQKAYVAQINQRYKDIQEIGLTIGQYFAKKLEENEITNDKGKFYTYRIKEQVFPRKAYMDEFDRIMSCQKAFYPEILTDANISEIRDRIIYYQRELKSCKHLVSLCEFEKQEYSNEKGEKVYGGPRVAPRTSPLSQVCKIWESVNALTLKNRKGEVLPITLEQRWNLFEFLDNNERLTLSDLYRILGISRSDGWWGGKTIGKGLQGNTTKILLRNALEGYSKCDDLLRFNLEIIDSNKVDEETGEIIQEVSPNFLNEPLYRLWHDVYSLKDKNELASAIEKHFGISDKNIIEQLYSLDFVKPGFGNKSAKFMRKLIPYLQEGMMYNEACEIIGVSHSNSLTKEQNNDRPLISKMPQIQKGELRQPVVEKILNQMVNVVNALIEKYGKIDEVRVELARELKQSKDERAETDMANNANKRVNLEYGKRIEELGLRSSRSRIQKYKLWEESEHKCFYCGQPVNVNEFLGGFDVEIEHIIPKSLFFDDSFSNKVCSCRACNSAKGNRTAYDFMCNKSDAEFDCYLERIESYFKNHKISKTKRERLLTSMENIPNDFIDRQLRQSQYIARKSQEMLRQICRNVWATSGSVTDFLRHAWGYDEILHTLNFERYKKGGLTEIVTFDHKGQIHQEERIKDWSKRLDHRHHAVDALVIAQTRQCYIQRLNNLNTERDSMTKEVEEQGKQWQEKLSLLQKWVLIQAHFDVSAVAKKVSQILVSFKPGKRVASFGKRYKHTRAGKVVVQEKIVIPRGALHEDGIYGQIQVYGKNGELEKQIIKKYKLGIGSMGFVFNGKETVTIKIKTDKKTGAKIEVVEDKIRKVLDSIVDKKIRALVEERLNRGFVNGQTYKDNPKKAFENLKNLDVDPIYFDKAHSIIIKNVKCFTGLSAVEPIKYNEEGKPISFVKTGNNHHVAIYKDGQGVLHESVVTFWQAVERKKFGVPIIIENPKEVWDSVLNKELPQEFLSCLPNDQWEFVMSMQKNEAFILGLDEDSYRDAINVQDYATLNQHLYVVQNLSEKTYRFCLATDTKYDLGAANKDDKRYYNIQSVDALFRLNPHKKRISLLGVLI